MIKYQFRIVLSQRSLEYNYKKNTYIFAFVYISFDQMIIRAQKHRERVKQTSID